MDIILKDIRKSYGEKTVLDGLSCTIPEGSICAVMAPSGTGKTTLLRLMLGLEEPDSGCILGVPQRKSVVFQEDRLFPALSAAANIRMAVGNQGQRKRITQILTELGLADSMDIPVAHMSGGMARRTALARALLYPGELLVLDEPFTGLDEASRLAAAAVIRKYRAGRTTILVTHRAEDLPLLEAGQLIRLPESIPHNT